VRFNFGARPKRDRGPQRHRVQSDLQDSPRIPPSQKKEHLKTVNLHAKSNFEKGDVGRVQGHAVVKINATDKGAGIVTALQDIRAGSNGWFEAA